MHYDLIPRQIVHSTYVCKNDNFYPKLPLLGRKKFTRIKVKPLPSKLRVKELSELTKEVLGVSKEEEKKQEDEWKEENKIWDLIPIKIKTEVIEENSEKRKTQTQYY